MYHPELVSISTSPLYCQHLFSSSIRAPRDGEQDQEIFKGLTSRLGVALMIPMGNYRGERNLQWESIQRSGI